LLIFIPAFGPNSNVWADVMVPKITPKITMHFFIFSEFKSYGCKKYTRKNG